MKNIWFETAANAAALLGIVVVFAKLQSYSWWLIGSWTGALGVLAVLGLIIVAANAVELFKLPDFASVGELGLWLIAATVTMAGLLATTTRIEFISAGCFIGIAWLAQLLHHNWATLHHHGTPHALST